MDEDQTLAALEKLKAENDEMEQEIMRLTKGSADGFADTKKAPTSTAGIQVMQFGAQKGTHDPAGADNPSWRPPQCSRRTVLGGFFTS